MPHINYILHAQFTGQVAQELMCKMIASRPHDFGGKPQLRLSKPGGRYVALKIEVWLEKLTRDSGKVEVPSEMESY